MSWESSLEYYRIINQVVRERLGGLHSARIVMHSVNLAEITTLQDDGDWDEITKLMIGAAQRLEKAGADLLAICANTMHKVADDVQKDIRIPLLHIADAAAEAIEAAGISKVGLLGTKITMEEDFYRDRLAAKHALEAIVPDAHEREIIDRVVYDELCCGEVSEASKEEFRKIMENLAANAAGGIILGCTEMHLLVDRNDVAVPVFDTTAIHARSAAKFALEP